MIIENLIERVYLNGFSAGVQYRGSVRGSAQGVQYRGSSRVFSLKMIVIKDYLFMIIENLR
jgi:hypothetical protein